jgi:hypothetical protein
MEGVIEGGGTAVLFKRKNKWKAEIPFCGLGAT